MIYRNIVNIFSKELPKHKPLGRWNIEYCTIKINKKIDQSNEDHCGVCSQYEELMNEEKNNYNIDVNIKRKNED